MRAGIRDTAKGQTYQDQDVGHNNVVALQAMGLVRLELEAAILKE